MLTVIAVSALTLSTAATMAMEAQEAVRDSAAGCEGNALGRLSDPDRGPEMSNMLQEIAAAYEAAAIKAQGEDFTRMYTAEEPVRQHIDANVERFVEMDRQGELGAYLEECPQPY